jgi:hypothetical protein
MNTPSSVECLIPGLTVSGFCIIVSIFSSAPCIGQLRVRLAIYISNTILKYLFISFNRLFENKSIKIVLIATDLWGYDYMYIIQAKFWFKLYVKNIN